MIRAIGEELGIPEVKRSWANVESLGDVNRRIGAHALRAMKAGQLCGELAFKAYASYGAYAAQTLWHGSIRSPKNLTSYLVRHPVLSPQQAHVLDGKGHRFTHADPAVFCARTPRLPIVRSLLNEGRVPNDFANVALSRQWDKGGNRFDFTSQEYLDAVGPDIEGWVYGVLVDSADLDFSTEHRDWHTGDDTEYRIHHAVEPVIWIKTRLKDLPPHDLLILDGEGDQVRSFISELPQVGIVEHMSAYTSLVHARTLSGSLPFGAHPAATRSQPTS